MCVLTSAETQRDDVLGNGKMTMGGRARRTGVALVVALTASVVFGPPPAGAQDSPGEPPSEVRPRLVTRGECDPDTDEIVVSGEWSNPSELGVRFVDLSVTLRLASPTGDLSEEIDLTHLFPTELAPHETVVIGPERFQGDGASWSLGFGGEFVVEGFDPVPLVTPLVAHPGCSALDAERPPPVEEPAEPIEQTPRFTG